MNNISILFGLKQIFSSNLIIIGLFPPPPGGISVYIQRILPLLNKNNISYIVYNHGHYSDDNVVATHKKYKWWIVFFIFSLSKRKLIQRNRTIFHFHYFVWLHYFFVCLFSRLISENIIITVHNEDYFRYNTIKKYFTFLLISVTKYERLIIVSKNLNNELNRRGIKSIFLPALVLPRTIKKRRLNIPNESALKIATTMWRFNLHSVNRYGTELIFKLSSEFKDKITITIFVCDDRDKAGELELLYRYGDNLATNIKIIYGVSFIDYISNYDIFVRSNNEDGFGVSIVEALVAGVPAIASDTCERPENTILFKTGDYEDFKSKVLSSLSCWKLNHP